LVSLDGIYGDPQSWAGDYFDEQAAAESLAVLLDSAAMLMGRNTYKYFAPAWSSPSGPYLERVLVAITATSQSRHHGRPGVSLAWCLFDGDLDAGLW
jgi:dihydrofolate reductase